MTPPELWDFQGDALERLRANIRAGVKNQVLCAATGAGKTVLALSMIAECHARGKRAIFVVDRISLIDQTSAVFDAHDIPHGVIQANHWRWRPWERVQVASVQTLARRSGVWPDDLALCIVDECHAAYQSTLNQIAPRRFTSVGLSATPFTRGLGKHYDAVVTARPTARLIADGYLAPYRIYAAVEPDMEGAKVSAGEWTDDECETRSMPLVGDCVREYLRLAAGKKFIAFGSTVAHAQEIQRQFQAAGIQTGLYTYRGTGTEKAEMVAEFRKPDSYLTGLISVSALARGFDVPSVSCVIIARPLRKSLAEHVQMLGRGLRRDPEDQSKLCTIIDHAGNTMRLGADMLDFFERGITELDDGAPKKNGNRKPPEQKVAKCPSCHHVHPRSPTCPLCGHEYPKPRTPRHANGQLGEWTPDRSATTDDKQSVYSQLVWMQRVRGYKPGWVAWTYKERFGVWPRGMKESPVPATAQIHSWVQSRMIRRAKSGRR